MHEKLAQEITDIEQMTLQLNELFAMNQFEELSLLVEKRLLRLKALDREIRQENTSDSDWAIYRSFLLKIQELDAKQVNQVMAEKAKLTKATLKIDKGKAAVGIYQNISKG